MRLSFGALGLWMALGCTGRDPYAPGTPLGTFAVAGALASSTCGAVPDPWTFDVRLSHEGATLYWLQGGLPIEGKIDAAMKASLTSRTEQTVRAADAKTQTPACVLAREDVLDVVLADAAGAPVTDATRTTSFEGTLTYRFAPGASSGAGECTDQLAASGGDYAALPCAVTYTVTGTRTKAPAAK